MNISLYRSEQQKIVAGVLGGIAQRYGWNVTLLRIIFVIITLLTSILPSVLVYLVLWMVLPTQAPPQIDSNGYERPTKTVYPESKD